MPARNEALTPAGQAAAHIADLLLFPLSPEETAEGVAVVLLDLMDRDPSYIPPETFDASVFDRFSSRIKELVPTALRLARLAVEHQGYVYHPTPSGQREALLEAYYVLNALKRGLGPEHPKEKRYAQQHADAIRTRHQAEAEAREQAGVYGPVLGHYGINDEVTTPDCAFLIGKNYRVDDPPDGLYPGGRHTFCRCWSGPPRPGWTTV